jgi:(R,R)-butanediol dehydrogenase/meso-butanediol dehydrogenase/diacetyl reductase
MKAAVFREPGKPLAIEDVPDPRAEPGRLVLRVAGCGICGSDLHMSELHLAPGMVMGHEFAGVIAEVGSNAGDWKIGERVCALPLIGCGSCVYCLTGASPSCAKVAGIGLGAYAGGYAEYVVADARETFRLPESLPTHEGALVEPLAVGLHTVHMAEIRPGDDVLILGAGPVGLATALWARHAGAREIVVSDFVAQRRDLVARLGATATLDPAAQEVMPAFEHHAGRAPDVIIECVGVPGVIQSIFEMAPPRGRVVIAGVCMKPDQIVPVTAMMKELRVQFVAYYRRADFGHTLSMLRAGRIQPGPMITDVIGLDELPAAFEALRRPSTQCKVIVRP